MAFAEAAQLTRATYGAVTGRGAIGALSKYIGGFNLNGLDGSLFHLPGFIGSALNLMYPAKPVADKQA